MFKKSSRTKNIRRKIETTDDEPNEQVHIQKTVTSTEKKKKQPKKLNALSFNDAEEDTEETFQVKKSKASRLLNVPTRTLETESMELDTESYSPDMLEKLKAATPNLPSSVRSSVQEQGGDALLHEKFPSIKTTSPNQSIPDASAILAAKKKREQMRKGLSIVDNEDGFISLDETAEESGSRLIREEDMMDDGEEEFEKYVGDKFSFNKDAARTQEKERREGVREMIEEAEEDEEQSEEMARWENDRVKYGGVKAQQDAFDPYRTPTNYRPAQVPEAATLPTLTEMMRLLDMSMVQVNESIEQYQSNLDESLKTIENSTQTDADLMSQIEKGSQRYTYFQELAQYVNDLGEFLDAKFPELEKLESEVHDLLATKTEIVSSRRWQSQLDDLCQFNIIHLEDGENKEKVDEFGRVRELRYSEAARQRRWNERQERLNKRTDLAELEGDQATREQGLWTDDDMTEEEEDKKASRLQTIQTEGIQAMMADVGSDFNQLRAVKDRFEGWKVDFTEDYEKAYGSLSLPGAFDFYIRSELVSWDPFSEPMDLDSMHWHSVLSEYGVSREQADPDVDMLNKIVEKTVIKKIKSLLDTLDAASSRQMRYAAQIVEQISYYVDTEEKAFKELTMEIISILEKQMSHFIETIATAIPKSNLEPAAIEAKHRFFWSQCKYLKTLMAWRRLLPKVHLDQLGSTVMDRLITPILKPETDANDLHLQNEALLLLNHLKK
ncbi:nineteen complex-related protein 2-domain-containing protein [Blakeslea trispora]|nr:nineteen complex-related protein 2-domain-containing protein [Blakeslea trispora]